MKLKWLGYFALLIVGSIVIGVSDSIASVGGYVFGGVLVLLAVAMMMKRIFISEPDAPKSSHNV